MKNKKHTPRSHSRLLSGVAKFIFGSAIIGAWFILAYGIRYLTVIRHEKAAYVWGLVVCCLVASSLSALAFRAKSESQTILLALLIAAIACIYCAELWLRLFKTPRITPTQTMRDMTSGEVSRADPRTKSDVLNELRSSGIEAYSSNVPRLFQNGAEGGKPIMPFGGISRATIVYCNEDGYWAIYESDEYGFNNPIGLHQPNKVDIALIGDSFIEGACVRPDLTISSVLRRLGYKSISFGRGGSGPLIEFAIFKEYARALKPKVVLWFYSEVADLTDLSLEETVPLLVQYVGAPEFSQKLSLRQTEVDRILLNYFADQTLPTVYSATQQSLPIDFGGMWKLDRLRRLLYLTLPNPTVPPPELFRKIMAEVKSTVDKWDGWLYFVYLPGRSRYLVYDDYLLRDPKARQLVLEIVKELKIPMIDIHQELFVLQADPLLLFDSSGTDHYNANGYQQVVDIVAKRLAKDGFDIRVGE